MVKLFHSLAQALSDNKTLPALRFKTCRQKKGNQSESRKKKWK
jgi:type VI protein secretion system component Hcp